MEAAPGTYDTQWDLGLGELCDYANTLSATPTVMGNKFLCHWPSPFGPCVSIYEMVASWFVILHGYFAGGSLTSSSLHCNIEYGKI